LGIQRTKLLVSAVLSIPVVGLYLSRDRAALLHSARDYVSFGILLGSLFLISGGVLLDGDLEALGEYPVFGVGNAAGLSRRDRWCFDAARPAGSSTPTPSVHTVVFFIFLVSNVGGALTPLGPPLFLGYLAGVPFTPLRLAPIFALTAAVLLGIYFVWDTWAHRRESSKRQIRRRSNFRPLRARGSELGVTALWEYFWVTGLLSSVLDNAPTYLAFLALGQ
jgi:hypothetical protein